MGAGVDVGTLVCAFCAATVNATAVSIADSVSLLALPQAPSNIAMMLTRVIVL
jgi:hypothetical protein